MHSIHPKNLLSIILNAWLMNDCSTIPTETAFSFLVNPAPNTLKLLTNLNKNHHTFTYQFGLLAIYPWRPWALVKCSNFSFSWLGSSQSLSAPTVGLLPSSSRGFEGHNKNFVLNVGVQRQPMERCEEWHTVGRMPREVSDFSSRNL